MHSMHAHLDARLRTARQSKLRMLPLAHLRPLLCRPCVDEDSCTNWHASLGAELRPSTCIHERWLAASGELGSSEWVNIQDRSQTIMKHSTGRVQDHVNLSTLQTLSAASCRLHQAIRKSNRLVLACMIPNSIDLPFFVASCPISLTTTSIQDVCKGAWLVNLER